MAQINWKDWNNIRNSAGSYAKMRIAHQCLRDITRTFEDYNNDLESDAREAYNCMVALIDAYVAQCEARKAKEEKENGTAS